MRQVIIIVVAAGFIGYDLFRLNGHYSRIVAHEAMSAWKAIEAFVLSLF